MTTKEAVVDTIRKLPDDFSVSDILAELARHYRAELATAGTGVDPAHYGIESVCVIGTVDERHRLSADLPASVPPGPAKTVVVLASDQELSAAQWSASVGRMWALDWDDPREPNYDVETAEPADGAR